MFRNPESITRHRRCKRLLEAEAVVKTLKSFIGNVEEAGTPLILEFGCGDCGQTDILSSCSRVISSDIYIEPGLQEAHKKFFIVASVTDTPFKDASFDILFSNHVIEHIGDLKSAFSELKRIATPDALYAFSVPTSIWLMLGVPAYYRDVLLNILKRLKRLFSNPEPEKNILEAKQKGEAYGVEKKKKGLLKTLFFPSGHGVHDSFWKCFRAFRIKSWKRLFEAHGFNTEKTVPLLLYGPSDFPVIPTTRVFNRFGICSSVLFIMKKDKKET